MTNFEFQNSKIERFRVLKLENDKSRVSKLEKLQRFRVLKLENLTFFKIQNAQSCEYSLNSARFWDFLGLT